MMIMVSRPVTESLAGLQSESITTDRGPGRGRSGSGSSEADRRDSRLAALTVTGQASHRHCSECGQ